MQQQDECAQPDSAAARLYERYAVSIFTYARLHTHTFEDAEDVVLEVFTAALEQDNLAFLAEKQQLVWLRRVAQHKLVDRYRRAFHASLLPLEQVVETVRTEEHLSTERLVVRREELEQLSKAIGKLPLLQQQVLQLRVGNDLCFAEIAVLLNKREAAVRKVYSRTIALLRRIYEHYEREEQSYGRHE